jgi:hypothetical protein
MAFDPSKYGAKEVKEDKASSFDPSAFGAIEVAEPAQKKKDSPPAVKSGGVGSSPIQSLSDAYQKPISEASNEISYRETLQRQRERNKAKQQSLGQAPIAPPSNLFHQAITPQQEEPLGEVAAPPALPIKDNTATSLPNQLRPETKEEKVQSEQLVAKKKADTDAAVQRTASAVLEKRGLVGMEGSPEWMAQVEKQRKDIESGSAFLGYDAEGKPGLLRDVGVLEAGKRGWESSLIAEREASDWRNMDDKSKVEFIKRKNQESAKQNGEYIGERVTGFSDIAQTITGVAPLIERGMAASTTAAAMLALAPETAGASLLGLPAAAGILINSKGMMEAEAMNGQIERYNKIKEQNPYITDESAMKMAGHGTSADYLAGAAKSVAFGSLLKGAGNVSKPLSTESKTLLGRAVDNVSKGMASAKNNLGGNTIIGGAVSRTAKSGLEMGAQMGAIDAAKEATVGIDPTVESVTEKFKESFVANGEVGSVIQLFLHELLPTTGKVGKYFNSNLKSILKREGVTPEQVGTIAAANEKLGTVPPGTAEVAVKDLESYNKAADQVKEDGMTPEVEASVAGLKQKANKLAEQPPTPETETQIASINKQIEEIKRTGKVAENEINEVTGEPYQESTKGAAKPILEPSKPVSEMNSEELYAHSVETKKALKAQDKEFEGKTEQEKEDGGYYDVIDNVEDLKDASTRLNFIENAETKDDLASSASSVLTNMKGEPNEYQLALLNGIKNKAAELKIDPKDLLKAIVEKVGNKYADMDDAFTMMESVMKKITPKEKEVEQQRIPATTEATKSLPENAGTTKEQTTKSGIQESIEPVGDRAAEAKVSVEREAKTVKEKDEVKLPPQVKGGMERTFVFEKGEWKQKVGNETTKVGEKVQQEAQAEFDKINGVKNETKSDVPIAPKEEIIAETKPIEDSKTTSGGEPPKEPPEAEVKPSGDGGKLNDKGILNRLNEAKNVPEAAKKGFAEKGLKYEIKDQTEAEQVAKGVVDEFGIDDAVTIAETGRLKGGVNSAVFAEVLNRLQAEESKATTPEAKLEFAKKFAEVGIRFDEVSREKGRDIAQIDYFYKKSPLGVQIMENVKRKELFGEWSKKKEQSWKEFFDEMMKEPEFETIVKEQVSEGLKKERAESRKERLRKVDEFFDNAKDKFKGGATYSTIIPPQVITAALEGMKQAYHAGEKVAKIIEDAVDYISKELGTGAWDTDKFRKEWEQKLKDPAEKKKALSDEEIKAKILDKFRKKLKGLDEKQREELIKKSFKKIVDSGGLDYADFRQLIAEVTGRGEMTEAQATKLRELVEKSNAVDDVAKRAREERTPEALSEYFKAQVEAAKSTRELNEILHNKPDVMNRMNSLMQLNTLTAPALVNNPIYNIFNQLGVRYPVGLVNSLVDRGLQAVNKMRGVDYERQYNTSLAVQKEFFNKLGFGLKEAVWQLKSGLNRMDYTQKELYSQQIRPVRAMRDLRSWWKGEKNLSTGEVIDKTIQASPQGIAAEAVARALNIGDKPQRFAAEGAQAAAFAKAMGLKDMDYKLFLEFPREEAYRELKAKGKTDAEAAQKADYIKAALEKEGARSTFQQDNWLNDTLSKVFGGNKSGVGNVIKSLTVSPYIKIPSNAYWSYYNLVNPEVAVLQSLVHLGKARTAKGKDPVKSMLQNREARYWMGHAVTGMAMRAGIIGLVKAGIFVPSNDQDDTKKEREGEAFFERQGTVNLSKLRALVMGQDPDKVEGGYTIANKWLGQFGTIGNTIARRNEEMTPEQRENQGNFWDVVYGGMEFQALKDLEQGVFSNTSAALGALGEGAYGWHRYTLNIMNMFGNIAQPNTMAQIWRNNLPYYSTTKGDTFLKEIQNSALQRSGLLRQLSGKYPPSKINIWGDPLTRPENLAEKLFGINHVNKDAFARPLYEDYLKDNDTRFLPPAVMPRVNNQKLNTEQARKLETYVGQARKSLVAPYINDGARIEGFNKPYSQLSKEEKVEALEVLYKQGFDMGRDKFIAEYPEFAKQEKPEEEKDRSKRKGLFRKKVKNANS